MKKVFLPALLGLALVISCDKKHETTVTEEHAIHQTDENASENHADDNHDHADTSAKLELDNGKKWKTNAEMLPFIKEQEQLIDAYNSEAGDYKKLASDLQNANEKLIKSCTMTGKSHDVLHVWLTDHMNLISRLSKTATGEEADKLTDDLEHSMENYNQYFD